MSETQLDMGLVSAPPASPAPSAAAPGPSQSPPAQQPQQQPLDRTRGHSPARDQREAAGTAPGAATIKLGDRSWTEAEVTEALAAKAEADSRRLSLPSMPEGYKAELPGDFKVPEGMKFEFRGDDPLMAQARAFAHEAGLSQDAFSKLLSLHAASQVEAAQTLQHAKAAEIAKLGVNGPARITAVTNWLKAVGGPDANVLVRVLDYAPHSSTVQAFERMMQKFSSQGSAGFSQQHRSQPESGKIPGFENMSFEQRRLAQDQRNSRR
jgi:hypothetical protein